MSPTTRSLSFGLTVEDYEYWSDMHILECHASKEGCSYDDWVVAKIRDVMIDAGNAFIRNNPDLFRSKELV